MSYPCPWIKNLSAKTSKYILQCWGRSVKRKCISVSSESQKIHLLINIFYIYMVKTFLKIPWRRFFVPRSDYLLVSSAALPCKTQNVLIFSMLVHYNTNSFFWQISHSYAFPACLFSFIVRSPLLPPPLFKGGKVNLDWGNQSKFREGIWKIMYEAGAGLLKRGWGWHFSYLICSRFIIFTSRNYYTLCKIVLCIWRKTIFFCHHIFWRKVIGHVHKYEAVELLLHFNHYIFQQFCLYSLYKCNLLI